MFFSPDTSPSSLATSSPVESSATHVPSSPPRESRKSPPLPKLNLDDCKPIFSSTSTNTSNNAAANPSTAFVFTSSRTLRNLHNYSQTTDDAQGRQPSASSQVSSHVPASPGQQHPGTPKRPALSAAQLASHSVGAVDARCIVSLSMRAAGFVPLPRSPAHRPSGMSGPSTPMHSPVPTPADPPYFPPIVFVNPSNVTTTSLWDYQRNLQYGFPSSSSPAAASVSREARQPSGRPGIHPLQNAGPTSASTGTLEPGMSSSSSLFSNTPSSRSSMTSISSSNLRSPDPGKSLSQRISAHEVPVEGYPFPTTPPQGRSHSPENYMSRSTQKGDLPLAASPSMSSSTVSGSVTPLASSPMPLAPKLPKSNPGSASGSATSSSGSGSQSPASIRFNTRPPEWSSRATSLTSLSLTELCQGRPRAWLANNLILPPSTPISAARGEVSGSGNKTASGRKTGRPKAETQDEGAKEATSRLLDSPGSVGTARAARDKLMAVQESQVHATTPKRWTARSTAEDDKEDGIRREKKEKHRGREKDRETDREKERERRLRHKEKSKKSKRQSSSPTSSQHTSPTSTTPSPGRKGKAKERTRAHGQDRSHAIKEKALGPAPFTSFIFPPRDSRVIRGGPHTLGSPDLLLQREREREEAEFAKDAVLAHRERDREEARHHGEKQKPASRRMRVAAAPANAYTSTYDRGRGRGIGRGDRGGARGRGASVCSTSAASVMSGETMVQDEVLSLAEQLVDSVEA